MTEAEAKEAIKDIPVGAKIQLIKTNGDIIEVTLASHNIQPVEKKEYGNVVVPEMPAALTVQGKRWGVFRLETSEIVNIAQIDKSK